MPITVNEGGTLYELDTVTSNEGGTLYELDTVYSNEGGTLYAIHKAAIEALWTSFGRSYATIISQSNDKNSTTCKHYVNYVSPSRTPNTVKCTFNMKAGQSLAVTADDTENTSSGYISGGTSYLYDRKGTKLAAYHNMPSSKAIYTATSDLENCYMTFAMRRERSGGTVTRTITLTLS